MSHFEQNLNAEDAAREMQEMLSRKTPEMVLHEIDSEERIEAIEEANDDSTAKLYRNLLALEDQIAKKKAAGTSFEKEKEQWKKIHELLQKRAAITDTSIERPRAN